MELVVKPMQSAQERAAQVIVGLGNTGAGQALVSDVRRGVDAWDVHSSTKLKTWAQPPSSELVAPAVYHAANKTLLAPAADGTLLVCEASAAALVPSVQTEKLPGVAWRVVPVPACSDVVAVVLRDGSVAACNTRTGSTALCAPALVPEDKKRRKSRATAATRRKTAGAAGGDAAVAVLASECVGDSLFVAADVLCGEERLLVVSAVAVGAEDSSKWSQRGVAVLARVPAATCHVAAAVHRASGTLFALASDSAWHTYSLGTLQWVASMEAGAAAKTEQRQRKGQEEEGEPALLGAASGQLSCVQCEKDQVAVTWVAKDVLLVVGTLTDAWQRHKRVPPPGTPVALVLELVFGTALCVESLESSYSAAATATTTATAAASPKTPRTRARTKAAAERMASANGVHALCLGEGSAAKKDSKRASAVIAARGALFGCDLKLAEVSLGDAIARGLPTASTAEPPLSVMGDLDQCLAQGTQCVTRANEAEMQAIARIGSDDTPAERVVDVVSAAVGLAVPKNRRRVIAHLLHTRGFVPAHGSASFHLVEAVAARVCREQDIRAAWGAMELLLMNGLVEYCAAPRLLPACMEQDFVAGVELCLVCQRELPDSLVVAALRYVFALAPEHLAAFAREHTLLRKVAHCTDPADVARAYLMTRVILLPRNEVFSHKYLRLLSADQVAEFLTFLAQWLDIRLGRDKPLPGAAGAAAAAAAAAAGDASDERGGYGPMTPLQAVIRVAYTVPSLNQILRWAETLIDAHVSSLVLTPDNQATLAHMAACLRGELALFDEMRALQPLLAQLKDPTTLPREQIPPYQIECISF